MMLKEPVSFSGGCLEASRTGVAQIRQILKANKFPAPSWGVRILISALMYDILNGKTPENI